ncbi:MAG TPA: hypothetical protein GXX46_10375 [Peptococcaceae bacterium]|nr:hypothetical protein [Peptococcaceae bacterium]
MLVQYDKVFTADVKKAVVRQQIGDLTANAMNVMVGNGQLWFGVDENQDYYILAVNP